MKTIKTVVTTLAIANLLALAGFVGWLVQGGRLNRDRLEAIRAMLSKTVSQEAAEKEAEALKAKEEADAAKATSAGAVLPVRAGEKINRDRDATEIEHQGELRLASELTALREFLVRENDRLVALEADLKRREGAFAQERKKIQETEGTEQFKRALATLGGLKPKEAQTVLNEILARGAPDEAVAYLNAMDERQRSKVIAEFNKQDPKVAADLLERIRRYGVGPDAAEAAANEPAPPGP